MKKFINTKIILFFLALIYGISPIWANNTDKRKVPGLIDLGEGTEACFAEMGSVVFTSAYRFRSDFVNNNSERASTFSIPLVADLDGDGNPEVLTFGIDGNSESHGGFRYIEVLNGQTGQKISRMPFKEGSGAEVTSGFTHEGWHSAPAPGSLVDSDRNGTVELIMAFPSSGGSRTLQNRLASYNIVKSGSTYSLQTKWISADTYNNNNTSNLHKATPQICDLDGDGVPEVLVYNKIYNAQTGALLLELETISTAYMGLNLNAPNGQGYDSKLPFSYIYDIDLDGTYDVIAGGKIYKIIRDPLTGRLKNSHIIRCNGVDDGYTGVADIDGDGVADIVVVNTTSSGTSNSKDIVITVWNPRFTGSGSSLSWNPYIIAQATIDVNNRGYGSNSYVFIGDIDGYQDRRDGKQRPEIAILTGRVNRSAISLHPNISSIPTGDIAGGIPTSGNTDGEGCLIAYTYDPSGYSYSDRLKCSFVLEHDDDSNDTGFTMFDFDNDGRQEICYRDNSYLRIIKPSIPYVKKGYTESSHPKVILSRTDCRSATGFEYPVVADIDNDASAEIVVIGRESGGSKDYYGWAYAVGTNGDKFAPTRRVWNQFIYDPFKINDDLTTPTGPAINRLDPKYYYTRKHPLSGAIIKDYNPYNGTLIQPMIYTLQDDGTYDDLYEPIVYLTDAYIIDNNNPEASKRPALSNLFIDVTIGNRSTAKTSVSLNTPVMIYKNSISKANIVAKVKLGDVYIFVNNVFLGHRLTSPILPGDEVRMRILDPRINDQDAVYWVRLADDSDTGMNDTWHFGLNSLSEGAPDPSKGIGVAKRQYRDCNWGNQVVKVGKLSISPDAATVQAYSDVVIDVFGNDILPDTFFDNASWGSDGTPSAKIIDQPMAGNIVVSSTGRNTKIIYQNTQTDNLLTTGGIDSFTYQVKFVDPSLPNGQQNRTEKTTVYIYVLQSETGFATCATKHPVLLKELPEGNVIFIWNKNGAFLQIGAYREVVFGTEQVDSVYMIEPRISTPYTNANLQGISFPRGKLTITKNNPATASTMKWKGSESTDWYNPGNWVEIRNNTEIPAVSAPTACTNVIIPSGVTYYPILTSPSACKDIRLEDRAMIARIHYLAYENASVEITLNSSEKDRFIMWSAPLKDMYSGDYHYRTNNNVPQWGDVYMNLFQHASPVGGNAASNTFTATFGELDESLGLGKAFNLRVTPTTHNKDKSFIFPDQNESFYNAYNQSGNAARYPSVGVFNRTNGSKFITDGVSLSNGLFNMPVANDVSGSNLVQVVNPYMAYLKVSDFLTANKDQLSTTSYAVWNGQTTKGFTQIGEFGDGGGYRYSISNMPPSEMLSKPDYIAPLQSFFVQKKAGTGLISTVKMSPFWTTTTAGSPYILRSKANETNVLRIRASQGEKSSYAVLFYHSQAIPSFRSEEDMYKLFFDEIPLEVYSFTPQQEALAINASGNFAGRTVPLGLRIKDVGQVTLDFSGMETFGHRVYLIDNDLKKDKEIDLQKNPTYKFNVTKADTELNNRFSLRMEYTGTGLSNEPPVELEERFLVTSGGGYINVHSEVIISSIQVYNINGALIYSTNNPSYHFDIPAEPNQVYIVKAKIREEYEVRKVLVK